MDREGIITKVKLKMDEITPPGVDLPFEDIVGPILDESAKDIIEAAPIHLFSPVSMIYHTVSWEIDTNVCTITFNTPHNFKVGDKVYVRGITETAINGLFTLTDVTADTISYDLTGSDDSEADTGGIVSLYMAYVDDLCYIKVPDNYLRLYEIKFPLWTKPVREITKVESPAGQIQDNMYLKAGIGRPVVQIMYAAPGGLVIYHSRYFVCGKVATVTPNPTPSAALYIPELKPEEMPDLLIDALTWLAASKIMQVSGIGDRAQGAMQNYGLSLTQLAKV